MPGRFAENPNFVIYERKLVELHHLLLDGKNDSAEADALSDTMDEPGWHLDLEEADLVGGLSADLYQITNEEVFEEVVDPVRVSELHGACLKAAESGRWVEVLELLRSRPRSAPSGPVAALRAHAYLRLGLLCAAEEFERFARSSGVGALQLPLEIDLLNDLASEVWDMDPVPFRVAVAA
jgi:hypothetical protein